MNRRYAWLGAGHRLIRVMLERPTGWCARPYARRVRLLGAVSAGGMLNRRDDSGDRIRCCAARLPLEGARASARPCCGRRRCRAHGSCAGCSAAATGRSRSSPRRRATARRPCSPNGRCATSGRSPGWSRDADAALLAIQAAARAGVAAGDRRSTRPSGSASGELRRILDCRAATSRRARCSRSARARRSDEPTGRLRAQRLLLELGPGDLAMTHLEAARMLAAAGLTLGDGPARPAADAHRGLAGRALAGRDRARGRGRRRPRDRRILRSRPDRRGLSAVRAARAPDFVRARAAAPVLGPARN